MKIISLHVYGFGQLENVKIENLADFQVFYGENEAGKSTLMAFIHGILFGFPTKQQAELRYEPKHGSKYGGNLKVFTEDNGFAMIERVKGKAAVGDITVTCENGVSGGEELLRGLLGNIDKGLYQAIFSFNLHGLQNIHQMKSEEIGKFLFSAGTLGTDRLALADNELQKGLDARFKPGGKKPLINEKLQEIHSLNKELKAAAAKNQEYENLIQQLNLLDFEMTETQNSIREFQKKTENLKEWRRIKDFAKEEDWTLDEMNKLGEVIFPPRGIERLEALKPLLSANNARMISITDRIEHLTKELESLKPNLSILENESEVLSALEQYPLYQQLKSQEKQAEIRLKQLEEKLADIMEKLHLPSETVEMNTFNTNIYMKDKVERLSRLGGVLKERKQQLDNSFNEEKSALELLENNIKSLQNRVFSESEKREIEREINEGRNSDEIEIKLQSVRDKIEFYKRTSQQEKKAALNLKKQKLRQSILFAILFFVLGLYGLFTSQNILFYLGMAGLVAAIILFVGNLRKPVKMQTDSDLNRLVQEEQQLLQIYNNVDFRKLAALQEKLSQDHILREQLQVMQVKHNQQLEQYEKVIKRFEEWELETSQYKKEIAEVSKELGIPEYLANSYLLESFQLIEQYKSIKRELEQLLIGLETLKAEQNEITQKLYHLGKQFLEERDLEIQELVYLLRTKLKMEQEKHAHWKEKKTKLADLSSDSKQLSQEREQLESDILQLFYEAATDNEKEFYELGAKGERKAKLIERLEDLRKQLHHSFLSKEERESYKQVHNCDELIAEFNREIEELQLHHSALMEQQASIKYEIQRLEEGGVYTELLHMFKQKQFELEESAKEWAVYSVAQNILVQTIEKYKNLHLPRMLSRAEEYLRILTGGNYQRMRLHQSGPGFLIERKDGTIFEANELSQATTEQVYVSIRVALATTLYEKYRLPIIIDDSFVNFDASRTRNVILLLHMLKENQILFFTCHQHILHLFNKDELLYLNNDATRHSIT